MKIRSHTVFSRVRQRPVHKSANLLTCYLRAAEANLLLLFTIPPIDPDGCPRACLVRSQKVFADNFPLAAHNRSSRKCEAIMSTVQSPTRAILVPSPSVPSPFFPFSSPKIHPTPTPLPCGNLFLALSSAVTCTK